jgi:hypothetical protein
MTLSVDWQERLQQSEIACRSMLEDSVFRKISDRVPSSLAKPEDCLAVLSRVTYSPASVTPLKALAADTAAEPNQFEQWILLRSALAAIPKLAVFPACAGVKALWAAEAMLLTEPASAQTSIFAIDHVRFREMARIISLQRFPAGQFHWELSGLPRMHIPRTSWRRRPHALAFIATKLGGFAPLIEIHVNARRRNRLTLTESEGLRSYFLIAQTLKEQPEVKGLFATGWLFCESTGRITPQLAWLREFFLRHGAFVASTGLVPEDTGFRTGSEERRKLYEDGLYRPTDAYVLWPRREMLEWASRYQAHFAFD